MIPNFVKSKLLSVISYGSLKIAPWKIDPRKLPPMKIPPSENRPQENYPQKINPKKLAPYESCLQTESCYHAVVVMGFVEVQIPI